MKLHHLFVENLNSLEGPFEIDFDRQLGAAPLFLIHGPTGSGKSTLMDAVSLALFGETPRLDGERNNAHADPRHILTHGTGRGEARLLFSRLDGGRRRWFLASWSCRRAHLRGDGALQPPHRALYELEGPDPDRRLAGGITVEGQRKMDWVEPFDTALSGMTVDDFRRSVLLAQGHFAAFLQAQPDERAAILERITDTAIYSELGARASEDRQAAQRKVRDLEAAAESVPVLDEDHRNACRAELEAFEEEERRLGEMLGPVREALEWLQQTRSRMSDAAAGEEVLARLREGMERHRSDVIRWETHDRLGEAARLERERRLASEELRRLERRLEVEGERLEKAEKECGAAGRAREEAVLALEEIEKEWSVRQPEWMRARAAWSRLEQLAGTAERERDALVGAEAEWRGALREEEEDRIALHEALHRGRTVLARAGELPPREPDPRSALQKLRSREQALERAGEQATDLVQAEDHLARTRRQRKAGREADRENEASLRLSLALLDGAVRTRTEAERALRTAELAWRLVEARRELAEGEPCPVCGSDHHPWHPRRRGGVEEEEAGHEEDRLEEDRREAARSLERAEEEEEACRRRIEELQEEGREIQVRDARIQATLEGARVQVTRARAELDRAWRAATVSPLPAEEWGEGTGRGEEGEPDEGEAEPFAAPTPGDFAEVAEEIRRGVERLALQLEIDEKLEEIVKDVRTIEARFNERRRRVDRAETEREGAKARLARALEEVTRLRTRIEETFGPENPDTAAEALETRREAALRRRRDADALLAAKEALRLRIVEAVEPLRGERDALRRRIGEIDRKREKEWMRLGLPPEAALEGRLEEEEAETLRRRIDEFRTRATAAAASARERRHALGTLLRDRPLSLADRLPGLPAPDRLLAGGAPGSSDAGLSPEQGSLPSPLVPLPLELLAAEVSRLREERERLATAHREAIAGAAARREQLRADDEQRTRLAEAGEALEKARREGEIREELHALIGVRNGAAFRRFAQSLNLERIVEGANRHLEALNPRYRLVQATDAEGPTLDFLIEDRDLAGSRRSTRTLSGGESFLCSLALSLGLAGLRRNRLPIETLLLDEGFGTLDRRSLDEAIGVLEQLQGGGYRIGLISHVESLQERIPAQIRVIPRGGGRSVLRVEEQGASDGTGSP